MPPSFKLAGTPAHYVAIDEAIGVVQFMRNKCVRLWMDTRGISKNDLQRACAVLAEVYPFANHLNSQARQASADRAWFAISRFYDHCKNHKQGSKGYPKLQHDNRSVEYKQTGCRLLPDGKHITFTDGCGSGCVRLVANKQQRLQAFPIKQIKRVRIIQRASYYGQVHGVPVIAVEPQDTTQNCSGCGTQVKQSLSVRTHICPGCG